MNPRKLVPRLVHKRLVNGNARRGHQSIEGPQLLDGLVKRRVQTLLLGDVGLEVECLGPEFLAELCPRGLIDGLRLDVQDGHVAAHLANGPRQGEPDALRAARHDVVAAAELKHGTHIFQVGGGHVGVHARKIEWRLVLKSD